MAENLDQFDPLTARIRACRICAPRFAVTHTMHEPRPVEWLSSTAPILIAGQAPGLRVHESGTPFDDRSGDRLREWLGVDREQFYDRTTFAILPMAFCFPGYNVKGHDLAPPKICAKTWRHDSLAVMPQIKLTLLIGGYAQKWHLGPDTGNVTETVGRWRDHAPHVFPLPHPSWRNTAWLKKNPDVEANLLPALQSRVQSLIRPK